MAQVNPGRTSLLAWWALNESSGNATDSHTNSLTLTDNNTVGNATGKVSGARLFVKANSEYFSSSSSLLNLGDVDFTIGTWLYLNNKTNDVFLSKINTAGNQYSYYLVYNATPDRLRFFISSDGSTQSNVDADNLGSPALSTWYFAVVRYNAASNTLKIRVNNGTDNSVTHNGGAYEGTATFMLGAYNISTASAFADARQDETFIYKGRELTDDECEWLYNSGNGRTYAETATATGTLTATLGAVTLSASGGVPVATGTLSQTLGTLTASASGTVFTPKVLHTRLRNYVLRAKRSGY